jgi:hypothetical protein
MIKDKKEKIKKNEFNFVIDTTGTDGNAYSLLAFASKFCEDYGFGEIKKQEILDEMRSSDYTNLLLTFDKYFGGWVCLIVNLNIHSEVRKALPNSKEINQRILNEQQEEFNKWFNNLTEAEKINYND